MLLEMKYYARIVYAHSDGIVPNYDLVFKKGNDRKKIMICVYDAG